jgi:hypothetical protein
VRFITWAIACLLLTCPAFAQSSPTTTPPAKPVPAFNVRTTGDLVALCNTPNTDPSYPGAIGLCVGYGSGVLDYHLADTHGRKRARKVCLPAQPPTRGEARRMFVAWAQANPQYTEEPAVSGVMRFLIATFPCGK